MKSTNKNKTLIYQGAEARIFRYKDRKQDLIIKERISKKYRIKELDFKLRSYRTKREAKILEKLSRLNSKATNKAITHIRAPRLIKVDHNKAIIIMEYIEGKKLSEVLEKINYRDIAKKLALAISELHNNGIIHQDLTTSNIILSKDNKALYLIDFGLSFFSDEIEHKAVDLHLLKEALVSKHYKIWRVFFSEFIKEYKKRARDANSIIKRLEIVELRGRNKMKTKRT